MRRADREISDIGEITAILDACAVVRLGLMQNGEPYIVPLNFAIEREGEKLVLYMHSALSGRKIDAITANPRVCFEADNLIEIKKDSLPCKWSAYYESVIGWGTAEILEDADAARFAMELILKRYGFAGDIAMDEDVLRRTALIKLRVETVAGKANRPQN